MLNTRQHFLRTIEFERQALLQKITSCIDKMHVLYHEIAMLNSDEYIYLDDDLAIDAIEARRQKMNKIREKINKIKRLIRHNINYLHQLVYTNQDSTTEAFKLAVHIREHNRENGQYIELTNSDSNSNPESINSLQQTIAKPLNYHVLRRVVFWVPPLFESLATTMEFYYGINAVFATDDPLLGFLSGYWKEMVRYTILTLYLTQSIHESKRFTVPSIHTTFDIIVAREYPHETPDEIEEWPDLSLLDEMKAALLSLPVNVYSAFVDSITSFCFAYKAPEMFGFDNDIDMESWKAFAIFVAMMVYLSAFFSRSVDNHKDARHFIHGETETSEAEDDENRNCIQRYVPRISGNGLALVGSLGYGIETYFVMGLTFNADTVTKRTLLFSCTILLTSGHQFIVERKRNIANLNNFIENLHKGITCKNATAFIATLLPTLMMAEVLRQLMLAIMDDPEIPLPFNIPECYASAFCIGVAANELMKSITYNYEPIYNTPSYFVASLKLLKDRISNAWHKPDLELANELSSVANSRRSSIDNDTPLLSSARHATFYRSHDNDAASVDSYLPKNQRAVFRL